MTGLRARSRSYHRFGLTLPGALDLVMVKASKLSHMSGLLECTTFILQKARPKSKKGQVLTKVMGINGGNRTGSKDSTESFYQCQPSPTLFSHSSKKYLLNVYFVLSTEDTAVTKTDMVIECQKYDQNAGQSSRAHASTYHTAHPPGAVLGLKSVSSTRL